MRPNLTAARELRASGRHEEARELLATLVEAAPHDAELQYEMWCVHDFLGLESQAVPHYRAALAGELPDPLRRRAHTGLGSTYRTPGQYADAERVLREGVQRYPHAAEIRVFMAMVQHNLGRSKDAVESLLVVLAQTSSDPEIKAYAPAIELYAQGIERVWPAA